MSNENLCKTSFERTPKLSTHLVQFFVSDFEFVENYEGVYVKDKVKQRIFYQKDMLNSEIQPMLDSMDRLMPFIEEYFGESNNLLKMDHVGLSDQYRTYSEKSLGIASYE